MHDAPPAGSVQTWTRPVYTPDQDRDYVPPAIFSQVRAPVPLPRADIKDQTAHRRGLDLPPATSIAPPARTPRTAPSAAPAPARPACAYSTEAMVYAILAALPPGVGLIMAEIRSRLPQWVNTEGARCAAARLQRRGRIEQRRLLGVGPGTGGTPSQWRIVQPGVPWGDIPPGCCLPGQRPRRTPQGRGLA